MKTALIFFMISFQTLVIAQSQNYKFVANAIGDSIVKTGDKYFVGIFEAEPETELYSRFTLPDSLDYFEHLISQNIHVKYNFRINWLKTDCKNRALEEQMENEIREILMSKYTGQTSNFSVRDIRHNYTDDQRSIVAEVADIRSGNALAKLKFPPEIFLPDLNILYRGISNPVRYNSVMNSDSCWLSGYGVNITEKGNNLGDVRITSTGREVSLWITTVKGLDTLRSHEVKFRVSNVSEPEYFLGNKNLSQLTHLYGSDLDKVFSARYPNYVPISDSTTFLSMAVRINGKTLVITDRFSEELIIELGKAKPGDLIVLESIVCKSATNLKRISSRQFNLKLAEQ